MDVAWMSATSQMRLRRATEALAAPGQLETFPAFSRMSAVSGKSGRNLVKSGHRVLSVVLTRHFETSLRPPLHASDGTRRYSGS